MYRCGVCGQCSRPRQSRLTHVTTRDVPPGTYQVVVKNPDGTRKRSMVVTPRRQEIERETPVCQSCKTRLEAGATLRELMLYHAAAQPSNGVTRPETKQRPLRLGEAIMVGKPTPTIESN